MCWRWLILSFSLLLVAGRIQAAESAGERAETPKRGWWWYEIEKKEADKKDGKEEKRKLPSLADHPIEELWKMYPDDFQPLLMDFQKKAVMDPSVENVREYDVVQDIARRKALAFANVASTVSQMFPELSLEGDYPNAVPGQMARVREQSAEISAKIHQSKDRFALIYFYSPTCHYCAEQNEILKFFMEKYPWQIRKVDITEDTLTAGLFRVRAVPFIVLVHRDSEDSIPVAVGVTSLSSMEERIYRGIRLLGKEITPEEYSLYEFERGGGFDPIAPVGESPQRTSER